MDDMSLTEDNNEPNKGASFFKRGIATYIWIVLIIGSFMVGVTVGKDKAEVNIVSTAGSTQEGELTGKTDDLPEYLGRDVDFKIFWDVWNIIQENYIDSPVGETTLFYGALNGMVESLGDPYSTFLEPQTASEFNEELQGRFEGTGMEIGIRDDVLTVIAPLAESPAEKAGIRPKDVILSIDGYSTENININDAVNRIRGEKGTAVALEIYRPKTSEFLDINVVRDVIKIVSVELKNYTSKDYERLGDKKVALVKVSHFNADTAERFSKAVQDILLSNPEGVILDLRGNPGGYLDAAVDMTDWWLNDGDTVVIESYLDQEDDKYFASGDAVLDRFKTVVLIDGGSASGSEIVAGALQDHKRAVLIGETSFGKGSVQQLEDLDDGSAVKVTIARWLTPLGRTIDKEGIKADIEVERTVEDYNQDLDPQLDRAMEYFINGE